MKDYFKRVTAQTQTRFWINNVSRKEAKMAIEHGAVGCTQNPSYSYKMLVHPEEAGYARGVLQEIIREEQDDTKALVKLQRTLVGEVAKQFLPMYNASGGQLGYVSIQGDPFDESFDTIVNQALFNREAGPNIMAKIPVTEDGVKAIEKCIRLGVPLNCTEVMSIQQAIDVLDAYDRAAAEVEKPPVVYISHIAGIFDEYIAARVKEEQIDISPDYTWIAGKLVAQKIREYMDIRRTPVKLINGGARGLQHFTEWVGCDVANTINWRGTADMLLEQNPPVVIRFNQPVPSQALDELVNKIPDFEKAYFTGRLKPSEYDFFGPVELFRSNFCRDWKAAQDMISQMRKQ